MWRVQRGDRLAELLDAPPAFGSTFSREVAFEDDVWQERAAQNASWLAFDGDLPVGAVTLHRYPEQDLDEACVVAMWVAAHARGGGVADALVTALLDHARSRGLRRVTLDVADGNRPAIGFYQRCGFVRTGRTGVLPHHPDVTEFEMALDLAVPTADSR